MKKLFIILFFAIFAMSCTPAGVTRQNLNGNESTLPPELKGLKVYTVDLGGLEYVRVAILNNDVNSLTYYQGKTTQSVIIITPDNRVIKADEIISETDEIIVIRKDYD